MYGIEYLIEDGCKGGNNRNASEAKEREFLARFEKATQNGQIISVEEISAAYDNSLVKNTSQNIVGAFPGFVPVCHAIISGNTFVVRQFCKKSITARDWILQMF